ncbi:hypothetical protein AB0K09_07400 [Streptomyces sp. NPDC049577]|uniref:hypothetical protein n=1 Tax=Streptomyces sp. NPDC049577 TaxID=3155153 RepID=UPI00343607B5
MSSCCSPDGACSGGTTVPSVPLADGRTTVHGVAVTTAGEPDDALSAAKVADDAGHELTSRV